MAARPRPGATAENRREPREGGSSGAQGCLLRVFWILFGHVLIAALAGLILRRGEPSLYDLAYWAAAAAIIGARYVDIARFAGETAEGAPATMAHFRRFSLYVLLCTCVVWLAIHGWHSLQRA